MSETVASCHKNMSWIQEKLAQAFPGACIKVTDIRGDDQHFYVHIITDFFQDVPFLQRHRQVYSALEWETESCIHALSLCTQTPKEVSA
ncbi:MULTISPECIES: BolA/IbaG family iron-sulfur metabolism protein [Holospora]|uniref:Protein BolA n=2 Tax=Holospora TaxID=44747 RepID=A0A061JI16_9PROT|nr:MULTISPECIES: BolA/IbaG family iron-sulfur metabolism protein [Holospora]ETZ04614.1 protein BolA [Holospora undulata HU1]GAJ46307.1 protein BolA [Holospora elegans E1]